MRLFSTTKREGMTLRWSIYNAVGVLSIVDEVILVLVVMLSGSIKGDKGNVRNHVHCLLGSAECRHYRGGTKVFYNAVGVLSIVDDILLIFVTFS